MVRSYSIDESLVTRAVRASGDRPVDQVLSEALEEYARRRLAPAPALATQAALAEAVQATADADPAGLIELFGTIDYLPGHDPLTERKRQAAELHQRLDQLQQSELPR